MLMMRDDRYAVAVADAFSRITAGSRIGVCTFQGGVNAAGMQYAYAGMAQAYEDGSPVLCITDGVPAGGLGQQPVRRRVGHEDGVEVVRLHRQARADTEFMRRAFTMLRSGRPGPVILAVPNAMATYDETADPYHPVKGWKSAPDPEDVRAAVDLLLDARNPLIYAGEGVIYAGASDDLKAFAGIGECAGGHDAQGERRVAGEPSAVCRRARRSGGALPEQKRCHPRHRVEPVAGPLQPRHSRSDEEDHHPLQR